MDSIDDIGGNLLQLGWKSEKYAAGRNIRETRICHTLSFETFLNLPHYSLILLNIV